MPIHLTKAVKSLLAACFIAFLIQQTADQFLEARLMSWFALIPARMVYDGMLWQLFTYSFMHSDVMHLFFNLMMLAFIGGELEAVWGSSRFLKYYFFCATSAGLLYLFLQLVIVRGQGAYMPMIGASGAIYGLLMAYGLLFGERVLLFMMLFPMKAKHFVWVLALIELLTTIYSGGRGLASIAHLGGMAAGLGYLWARANWLLAKKRKETGALGNRAKKNRVNHLKLIVNNDREFDSSDDDESENGPKTWH